MPDAPARTCPKCATAIPTSFPEGFCPKCMLASVTPAAAMEEAEGDKTIAVPAPTPSQMLRPGGVPSVDMLRRMFPDLEILDVLGAGGMGAVYKARQPRLNRLIALKIMVAAPGHEVDFALRFEREAQVLARLSHPHIVILYDFGELGPERTGADPLFYFLMEYVDGTDLGQLIKSKELQPAQALAIVPQICEALQYAHDQGITHRDIKPANILIDKRGVVKIADFGLAKMITGTEEALMTGLTQTGTAMGTPHYMAPEQWEHPQQVDHRADIYALGVVFYEMLTGERPAGVFEPPSKKTKSPVDKKLDGVVMRAMDKNPDRRYQQAGQIGDDVTRITGANKSRPASASGTSEIKGSPLKSLLVLGSAAALAIGGWWVWQGREAGPLAAATPPPASQTAVAASTSKAMATFPAGQWTKVLSTQAEVDALVGLKGKVTIKPDGWLDFSGPEVAPGVGLTDFSAANAGVRVKGRIADKAPMSTVVMLTLRHTTSLSLLREGYRLHITGGETANPSISLAHYDNTTRQTTAFKTMLRPGKLKAGEEFSLEFYTIGSRLFGRFNGGPLLQAEDQRLTRGVLTLQTGHLLRDIEVINLDGLSEAEALKLAGVDSVVPSRKALGGPSALPIAKPGRLEGTGTMATGRTLELVKFDAYEDFVEVAGSSDFLVALRTNGETVSSDGQADFTGIRRIARSFQGYHCFIDMAGSLRFHPSREMTLPSSLKGRVVVDAACGSHHGVALLEGGQAMVFGKRYEEAMEDANQAQGLGTPRWPQPEAAALQNVKGVAVTYTHAATLHEDGTVSVWGWEGPVKWQPEAKMKPVQQISSHHDSLHLLDEAGQVWSFPMPRSAHPEQPVGFNGTVRPLDTAAVRMRDHLWLGADGAWHGVAADRPVQELLERTDLQPEINFALLSSTANTIPFGYVLWIEPVSSASPIRQ